MNMYQVALRMPTRKNLDTSGQGVCGPETRGWETLLPPCSGNKAAAVLGRSVRFHEIAMGAERFVRAQV